jgi:hypothetical protein
VCKELAKSEADLEKIREHDAFKQLINWSQLSRWVGKYLQPISGLWSLGTKVFAVSLRG